MWKFEKSSKAVFFEKVIGKQMPVAGNLFQNKSRICMALGMPKNCSTEALNERVGSALKNPITPETVENSLVKQVILRGEEARLEKFPIPTFFEGDAGSYITAGACIVRHLNGSMNMGIYRIQVLDGKRLAIHASPRSDLYRIFLKKETEGSETLETAIAIGVEPATIFAAILKPLPGVSEFNVAGALKGEPIKITECETVDLMVPCEAEIVLEGEIRLKEKISEGPFGEIGGYYGTSISPVMEITAIYYRKQPIFHVILPGPSSEHFTLINLANIGIKKSVLKKLKEKFSSVKDLNLVWSPSTGTMMKLIISLENKGSDIEPREILETVFNLKVREMTVGSFVKQVVVVDEDVNIYDSSEVEWAVNTRTPNEKRIIVIPNFQSWNNDYAAEDGCSVRFGIDATKSLNKRKKFEKVQIPKY
jgi:2,5-furandicarboxylate decarboxylase 1